MRPTRPQRAFTLLELAVACTLFLLLSAALFTAIRASTHALNFVQDNADAQTQLRMADYWLQRDLRSTSLSALSFKPMVDIAPVAGSGGGYALWFLSPKNPVTGKVTIGPDGGLVWRRNILYYLARPSSVTTVSGGIVCNSDDAAYPGNDPYCPYKVLIRKVIRNVIPDDAQHPEALLTPAEVQKYLTQPDGYSVANMSSEMGTATPQGVATSAGVDPGGIRIVAKNLLSFEVDAPGNPDASNCPPCLAIDLRAVRLREALKSIAVGHVNLLGSPYTIHFRCLARPND